MKWSYKSDKFCITYSIKPSNHPSKCLPSTQWISRHHNSNQSKTRLLSLFLENLLKYTYTVWNVNINMVKRNRTTGYHRDIIRLLICTKKSFGNLCKQETRLAPGYFPPSNFGKTKFLWKITLRYAFYITVTNFSQFWRKIGFFYKTLNLGRKKSIGIFKKYYHFIIRILHQNLVLFPIFENFFFSVKTSIFVRMCETLLFHSHSVANLNYLVFASLEPLWPTG